VYSTLSSINPLLLLRSLGTVLSLLRVLPTSHNPMQPRIFRAVPRPSSASTVAFGLSRGGAAAREAAAKIPALAPLLQAR